MSELWDELVKQIQHAGSFENHARLQELRRLLRTFTPEQIADAIQIAQDLSNRQRKRYLHLLTNLSPYGHEMSKTNSSRP